MGSFRDAAAAPPPSLPPRSTEPASESRVSLKAPPGRKLGELPEIQELAGKVRSTLMLLDDQQRVVWVNRERTESPTAMTFTARCIPAELDRPALTLVMMKDVPPEENA